MPGVKTGYIYHPFVLFVRPPALFFRKCICAVYCDSNSTLMMSTPASSSSASSMARDTKPSAETSSNIPVEIFYHILENLPHDSLPSVARTSTSFNDISEKFIYRRLDLTSVPQTVRCCQTLIKKPTAAQTVRECIVAIRLVPDSAFKLPYPHTAPIRQWRTKRRRRVGPSSLRNAAKTHWPYLTPPCTGGTSRQHSRRMLLPLTDDVLLYRRPLPQLDANVELPATTSNNHTYLHGRGSTGTDVYIAAKRVTRAEDLHGFATSRAYDNPRSARRTNYACMARPER